MTDIGRAYKGLASRLRQMAGEAVPEYGAARNVAADAISRSKAVEFGSKLLHPSVPRDKAANIMAGWSGAEKEAAKQGVRSYIDDALANVQRTVTDGNTDAREAIKGLKSLSSRANRDKMEQLLGKDEAEKLFSNIDQAAASFDLRANLAQNSKTFQRAAIAQKLNSPLADTPGAAVDVVTGNHMGLMRKVANMLTNSKARNERDLGQIADWLTRPSGETRNAISQILNRQPTKLELGAKKAAPWLRATGTAAGALSYNPLTRLLAGR